MTKKKETKLGIDIPTYFNNKTLNLIKEINRNAYYDSNILPITSVYGSITGLYSARETKRLKNVQIYNFKNHLKFLKKIDVDFYYAMNASCLGSLSLNKMLDLKNTLKILTNYGVENYIVAHPFLIELIREQNPKARIKASVIMEIDNVIQLDYFLKNTDVVNISTKVNRDFKFLEKIGKHKEKIEILCNETCLFMCPFRASHYNIESHRHKNDTYSSDYPVDLCYEKMTSEELVKSRFVLPEWIKHYEKYALTFKISGRSFPEDFIYNTARYYSNRTSPDNILDLFPIVTGSISNEQHGIIDSRKFSLTAVQKENFISFFKSYGHECPYVCPCPFCKSYVKNFSR